MGVLDFIKTFSKKISMFIFSNLESKNYYPKYICIDTQDKYIQSEDLFLVHYLFFLKKKSSLGASSLY